MNEALKPIVRAIVRICRGFAGNLTHREAADFLQQIAEELLTDAEIEKRAGKRGEE